MADVFCRGEITCLKYSQSNVHFQLRTDNQVSDKQGNPRNCFEDTVSSTCYLVDPKEWFTAAPQYSMAFNHLLNETVEITFDIFDPGNISSANIKEIVRGEYT